MTNKEFRRLSRSQLIEIIYQLQLKQDELMQENQRLENELSDRRLRISKAGSIADAALEINECFSSAQKAAEQYLEEIRTVNEETQEKCRLMLENARKEAGLIIEQARNKIE